MTFTHSRGLREEKTEDLKIRIIEHRNRFIRLFYARYRELLPSLIVYENKEQTSTDFLKVEVALRNNYDVVIGKNNDDRIVMLGYATDKRTSENPSDLITDSKLSKDDIHFIIPRSEIPKNLKEISFSDDCETGNFVVLRNKTLNYMNDLEVIEHYTAELAELVLSRYSIAMQAKINTFFISEANDETINQIATDLYTGAPYVKVTNLFDPIDNIHTIENEYMASNFIELKREYQNKISELNNMLGINSLAVEKASGVSDTEAKSNRSFTTSNANIYLQSRNEPLEKLNKRFNLNLQAIYNDEVASEFAGVAYSDGGGEEVDNKGTIPTKDITNA